jgi:hypothetical protein
MEGKEEGFREDVKGEENDLNGLSGCTGKAHDRGIGLD